MISSTQSVFTQASTRAALVAVFTGLSLGTNYVMIDLPNVKLMDALIFAASFLFGLEVGLGAAVCSRLVYGFVNPWGQAPLSILPFLIIGECFYALAGTLLRRTSLAHEMMTQATVDAPRRRYLTWTVIFGVTGLLATFAFDVLTNFGSYVFTSTSLLNALIIGMATGAPFAILHEGSNLWFFPVVALPAVIASKRFLQPTLGARSQ